MDEQSIRPLLDRLQASDALLRITKPVGPSFNLAALEWQAYNRFGKATQFESVMGHLGWRVASQLLADRPKWAQAFDLPESELLFTLRERMTAPRAPVAVTGAPVKAVRAADDKVDLAKLPAPLLCA